MKEGASKGLSPSFFLLSLSMVHHSEKHLGGAWAGYIFAQAPTRLRQIL